MFYRTFFSGKTHTLMSSDGMTAYLVSRLFAKIARDSNNTYEVMSLYLLLLASNIFLTNWCYTTSSGRYRRS